MKIAKYLIIFVLLLSFSIANADIDSKLRVRENGTTVSIAGSATLSASRLHMKTTAGIISVLYVAPNDPRATKTIIKLVDGTKMALKKFLSSTLFPNKATFSVRHCSAPQRTFGTFAIANNSPTNAQFVLATSTGGVSPSDFIINANSTSTIEMSVAYFNQVYTNCMNSISPTPPGSASYYVYQNGVLVANPVYVIQADTGSL